jgi:ATP-dependent helicase/nuclease subunit B
MALAEFIVNTGLKKGANQVEAYYWFVGEDQGYERRGYDVDDTVLAGFQEALSVILDGISSGLFPARPGKAMRDTYENCNLCPYDRVCPGNRSRLWERKRSAPDLKRYLEMAEPDE